MGLGKGYTCLVFGYEEQAHVVLLLLNGAWIVAGAAAYVQC